MVIGMLIYMNIYVTNINNNTNIIINRMNPMANIMLLLLNKISIDDGNNISDHTYTSQSGRIYNGPQSEDNAFDRSQIGTGNYIKNYNSSSSSS